MASPLFDLIAELVDPASQRWHTDHRPGQAAEPVQSHVAYIERPPKPRSIYLRAANRRSSTSPNHVAPLG